MAGMDEELQRLLKKSSDVKKTNPVIFLSKSGTFRENLIDTRLIDNRNHFFDLLDEFSNIIRVRYGTIKALLQQSRRLGIV
jgi:hypothetical protein